MRRLMAALLLLLAIATLAGCDRPKSAPKESEIQEIVAGIPSADKTAAKNEVAHSHTRMNDMVEYGHWRRFTDKSQWSAAAYQWVQVRKEIKSEEGMVARARGVAAELESGTLKQDLEAFARALEHASEAEDVESLKLAHRIVHDLDYWVLDFQRDRKTDYWRATVTLAGARALAAKILD